MHNTCRLCKKHSKLKKSHIFPRWMVMHCRDKENGNRFEYISSHKIKKPQDGPKEYLLCNDCEQQLSTYEIDFKQFFLDMKGIKIELPEISKYVITGHTYHKIRLFILSILWRLAETTEENFTINVSDTERERIRRMLLDDNAGSPYEFPISATLVQLNGNANDSKLFMSPQDYGPPLNLVIIYMAGVLYKVSKNKTNEVFTNLNVLTPVSWAVSTKHFTEIPLLMDAVKNLDLKSKDD